MKNIYYDNHFDKAFEEAVDALDRAERQNKEVKANV